MTVTMTGAPTWIEQGPAAIFGGQPEGIANRPVAGAINAIAVNPADPKIVFVGAVNGGIWGTQDINATNVVWQPKTDQFPSLSISDIAFSPLDKDNRPRPADPAVPWIPVLYAVTGTTSSANLGGGGSGVLKSIDGGQTWSLLSFEVDGGLGKRPLTSVVPTALVDPTTGGAVVLVSALNEPGSGKLGGVFRSRDGGKTFRQLSGPTVPSEISVGLPAGQVTSLIADPNDPAAFFAGIPGKGIYRGVWQPATGKMEWVDVNVGITRFGLATTIKLAAGATAAPEKSKPLYVGLVTAIGLIDDIFRSDDRGENWTRMTPPNSGVQKVKVDLNEDMDFDDANEISDQIFSPHNGNQGNLHFSIVADPTSPYLVYVAGDRQRVTGSVEAPGSTDFVGALYRGDASQAAESQWQPIVSNFANGTAPHSDSRDMVYVGGVGGYLLEADDGGIYRFNSPHSPKVRKWDSRNGNIRVTEMWSAAYDSYSNVIFSGNQDNGSAQQSSSGSSTWTRILPGDGLVQAVGIESDRSVRYSMPNNFAGFTRNEFALNGNPLAVNTDVLLAAPGSSTRFSGLTSAVDQTATTGSTPAFIQYVVNTLEGDVNQRRMLIGWDGLYESADRGDHLKPIAGGSADMVTALAYGGKEPNGATLIDRPDVIYVARRNCIYVREPVAAGQPFPLGAALSPGVVIAGAGTISDIVLDPNNWRTAYAIDSSHVYMTQDGGHTWNLIRGPAAASPYRTIEVVRTAGQQVLLLGGLGGVYRAIDPDPVTNLTPRWSELGRGLPNVLVTDLHYNDTDKVLLAATLGRGAWTLPIPPAGLREMSKLTITGSADADRILLERNANNPT
ncbi:MAG TPA: sialidase family protein, partial [Gemmataceae bacterium]|nr:sialidase family protein [Gemmataceae bacterium]